MKRLLLLSTFFFCLIGVYAQTDNYGLHFETSGNFVNSGRIRSLENTAQFTLEAWIKVETWEKDAKILSYGSTISVKLDDATKINVAIGGGNAKITSTSLVAGKWNLLTLSYNGAEENRLTAFVNGEAATVEGGASLPALTPNTKGHFFIAGGLKGWMDEIRIWKKPLAKADIILKTTISPYNNNFSALAAYYKCDQITSPGLVDYSNEKHHGQFTPDNSLRQKVTDNSTLGYRPITGYISLGALADGTLYDKQQLLMCNDIALLNGLRVNTNTGEAYFELENDNDGQLTNAGYAASLTAPKMPTGIYEASDPSISRVTRNGVIEFKGAGAQMNVKEVNLNGSKVTFQSWLYVNQWTPGAALFEKKGANGDEISLKMGATDGEFIFTVSAVHQKTRYREVYPLQTSCIDADDKEGERLKTTTTGDTQYWHFLSFVFDGTQDVPVSLAFDGFVQGWPVGGPFFVEGDKKGMTQDGKPMPIDPITNKYQRKITALPTITDGDMLVGKDLNGCMDEVAFWGVDRTKAQRQKTDALNVGLEIGKKGVYYTIQSLKAYYRVLNEATVCKNEMNFKELFNNLLKYVDGTRGYQIRLSVTGSGTRDWRAMLADPTIRKKAAENLAKVIENNPADYEFTGLDFDFEWSESQKCQDDYTLFIKEIKQHMKPEQLLTIAINGTMPWTYKFTEEAYNLVDFFTAEDYGPFPGKFTYETFESSQKNYEAHLPKNKIMPSIGIYGVGDNKGELVSPAYRTFAHLEFDDDANRIPKPDTKLFYNFCGINQSRARAQYALDAGDCGFMFYDMVCDILPTERKSLTRAVAQVLPSDNEFIVEVPNEVGADAKINGVLIEEYVVATDENKTDIVLTGAWDATQINLLKQNIATANLKTVDMSRFTLVESETAILLNPFKGCQLLESIKMPVAKISSPVSFGTGSGQGAFTNCKKLKEVDLSMFTHITGLQEAFFGSNIEIIKMPTEKSPVAEATAVPANNSFKNCPELRGVDLSSFNSLSVYSAFVSNGKMQYLMLPKKMSGGNAFPGSTLNPDCLVYAYEGTGAGSGSNNLITTTDGIAYSCATPIVLNPEKEFYCPKAFTAPEGVSYTRNFSKTTNVDKTQGWESICLPFKATSITNNETAIEPIGGENAEARKFTLYGTNEATNFAPVKAMAANTPYVVLMPKENNAATDITGDVVFKGIDVPVTIKGTTIAQDFDLTCAYSVILKDALVYAIDETGTQFVSNGADVKPFHAYVVNKAGSAENPTFYDIAVKELPEPPVVNIEDPAIQDTENAMKVYSASGKLIVDAAKAETIYVSSIEGIIRAFKVTEGINEFELPQGLYIVNKKKVMIP